MSTWHLHLFGEVSLAGPDTRIQKFETVRAAKLLVLLCLSGQGKISREVAAEQLWPEDPPDSSRLRLRQEIHRLKKSLGDAAAVVGANANEIWVNRNEVRTDLDAFSNQAQSGEVLPGEFLPGWDDTWAIAERNHAEDRRLRAVIAHGTALVEQCREQDAISYVQPFIKENPLEEDLRMVAVSAYSQMGKMAAAVAEYQDLRRQVREQLGIELDPQPQLSTPRRESIPSVQKSSWQETIPIIGDETIGRDQLIEEISELLQEGSRKRLITLVGPGGIGKTRLATEVLAKLAQTISTRLAFVTLANISDRHNWVKTVASQLKVEVPEGANAIDYIASEIEREPTILVLDNAESILPQYAAEIGRLIRSCPRLKLLVTSVTPVRIDGEITIKVGTIDPATDGVDFLERAYLAARGEIENDAEAEALRKISLQLDGYPLALRLASSRLKLLAPSKLLEQLESSLASARARDLPERHRSLESALSSCVESLDEELLDALERIACYPGGLGMELAAVEFEEGGFLDLFEELLDASLIVLSEHSGPSRVRMLVPVRNFVRARLKPDRFAKLKQRTAINSIKFLTQFELRPGNPISHDLLVKVDEEEENFRWAWRFALDNDHSIALNAALHIAGYESCRARANSALDDLLSLQHSWEHEPPLNVAEFELAIAHLCASSYREDLIPEALEIAAKSMPAGEKKLAARIALARAEYAFRKDYSSGAKAALTAIELAETAQDVYLAAKAHRIVAAINEHQGDLLSFRAHINKSLEGMIATGAETEAIRTAIYSATQDWYAGNHDKYAQTIEIAYSLLEKSRDPLSFAYLHEVLGRQDIESREFESAEAHFQESLRIWRAIGCDYQEADQLYCLAKVHEGKGQFIEAKKLLKESAEAWFRDNNFGGVCAALSLLCRLLEADGQSKDAGEVIAFANDLRNIVGLTTVKSELDLMANVASRVGEGSHKLPLTIESAKALFDRIR